AFPRAANVLPGAVHAWYERLAAQPTVTAVLTGPPRVLGREGAELVDQGVDGVLQLQHLAPHVDGDLLGEVAVGDRGGDVGDVADLAGEVAGHGVHRVGEVLPRPGHAPDVGLATQPPFGSDLAGHPGDLGGEARELVDHRVDGGLQLEDLALDVDGDFLGQVPARDGLGDLGDVADLAGEVAGH